MTISAIDQSQRTAAKVAGFTCLFGMAIVVFVNYWLLNPLIVPDNAAETARNIMAHERQLRLTVTCFLIYSADVIVLLAALYVILRPVNRGLALGGAFLSLVFALLWLLTKLNLLSALRLLSSASYLQVFEADRLQALARVQAAANFDAYYVGLPFVICAFVFLIFPYFNKIVNDYWFDSPMALFETALSVWLLFKGLRPPGIAEPVPAGC